MVDPTEQYLKRTRVRSDIVNRYAYQFIPPYEKSVFPIFQRSLGGASRLAGTGFFLAPSGIFLSAAHVFELEHNEGDSYWIIYIDSDGNEHDLNFVEIMIKPEGRDIALGQVEMSGLDHPVVSIMELLPEIDEVMASFAFSHTLIHNIEEQDGVQVQRVQYRSHWEIGKVGRSRT